jgi:hypothetical protein
MYLKQAHKQMLTFYWFTYKMYIYGKYMPETMLEQDLETTGSILHIYIVYRYARYCSGAGS